LLCVSRASPLMLLSSALPDLARRSIAGIGRFVVVAVCLACVFAADASESRRKPYALPAGEAPLALNQFAEQSGEQVIFLLNQVKGVRTNAVNGRFTAREAIERLVADTGLRVVADQQTGAFMIQRLAERPPPGGTSDSNKKRSPEKSGAVR
jgi:hypothetical protein